MMSMGEGARRETLEQVEQLGMKNTVIRAAEMTSEQAIIARKRGSQGLLLSDGEHLKRSLARIKNVGAAREIKAMAYVSSRDLSPQILAITPNYLEVLKLGISSGRSLVASDISQSNPVCLLGSQIAKQMGDEGKPGGVIRLGQGLYHVVGILNSAERKSKKNSAVSVRDFDHTILLPLSHRVSAAGETRQEEQGTVSELIVESLDASDVLPSLPLLKRVMEVIHHGALDYRIVVPQELLRQANETQRTFNILMVCIALISLFIGGIGIMNMMLANVAERTHEIGMGRALGATREFVIFQFLAEATVLTLVGGGLGVFLGIVAIGAVSFFVEWRFSVTAFSVILPLVTSALTGLVFGLYPAIKAADMDPVAALRY